MSNTIWCRQCGSENPQSSKFCGECGKPLITSEVTLPKPEEIKPVRETTATCPICHRDDQTQKVSAIVASQTSSSSSYGYSYSADTSFSTYHKGQTALAERLRKPSPPLHSTNLAAWTSSLMRITVGIMGGGIGILAFFGILDQINRKSDIWWCSGVVLLVCVMMVWASFAKSEPTPQQQQEVAKYLIAEARWGKSYYCYRDDIAFLEYNDDKYYNNSANFMALLYGKLD